MIPLVNSEYLNFVYTSSTYSHNDTGVISHSYAGTTYALMYSITDDN
jgi:hypothetical protein